MYYLKSFVKFPIITCVRHIGFSSGTPNNICPWLGVEKCTRCTLFWKIKLTHRLLQYATMTLIHTVYREVFVPLFYFAPFTLLSVGEFKIGWIRSPKSFPLNTTVWANSRRGKTFYKWRRANISLGENNFFYNSFSS